MQPIDRKLLLIFCTMAAVLIATTATLFFLGSRVLQSSELLAEDHKIIAALNDTLSSIKDAETGQRGFVITGKEIYLDPYNAALPKVAEDFRRLQGWVASGHLRAEAVAQLRQLADAKLAELAQTIGQRRDKGLTPTTQFISGDVGNELMVHIRRLVGDMLIEQEAALAQTRQEADHTTSSRTVGFIACTLLELAFLVWCAYRVGREVNARQKLAVATEEQRELYATTLASIGDAVITTDATATITFINTIASTVSGWSAAEAVGKPLSSVFQIINETTRKPVESPADKVLRDGVIVGLANHTLLIRKDGTEVPIDDSGAPIHNRDGSIRGVVLVFRDFSAQKQAEAAVRRSEERLRLAIDAAELGTFYCDFPFDKIVWNDTCKRHFFLPPDADINFDVFYSRLHPDDLVATKQAIDRAVEQRLPYDVEYRVVSPAGEMRWIRAIGRVYFNPDGSPLRFDGITIDVNARKLQLQKLQAAQNQAEAASKAKDQFLATLSHELRTPLTPVLATLELWSRRSGPPPRFEDDVRMLRRNVLLEARLIDDLLDLTRVVKGKLNLAVTTLDVHDLLPQVLETCREESTARQVTIDLSLHAEPAKVQADPARLQQVFWNVLRNAIKFSPERSHVQVATSNDADGSVRVAITDQGIGMQPETIAKLFRPFEQGSDDITRRFGGLGLGLAVSKALLDQQGGTITASSSGENKGTTFTVTLPSASAASAAATQPAVEPAAIAPGKRLRILLVEDHEDTARILKLIMISWGNAVETAASVGDAIRIAKAQTFDLLISDIGLPDGSGLDLIRQFRTISQIPAIALSGFGMEDDVTECMRSGFNAHLTKPTDLQSLQRTIAKLTNG